MDDEYLAFRRLFGEDDSMVAHVIRKYGSNTIEKLNIGEIVYNRKQVKASVNREFNPEDYGIDPVK